ncbi:hypothetical protein BC829DRAFT_395159 [Chytridium lagenaria]|nr:hypothetical protein BC829DRAFT_395159 [Chytridium lagenaria]
MATPTFLQRLLSTSPDVIPLLPPASDAIAKILIDMDCCNLCILRYFGIKYRHTMQEALTFQRLHRPRFYEGDMPLLPSLSSIPTPSSPALTHDSLICPACLGLLHASHRHVVDAAKELMKKEGYEGLETFQLSCRVPAQLATRSRAVHLCLQHRLEKIGIEYVPPKPLVRGDRREEKVDDGEKDKMEGSEKEKVEEGRTDGRVVTCPDETVEVKDMLKVMLTDAMEEAMGLKFDLESAFQMEIEFAHEGTEEEFAFMLEVPAAQFSIKRKKKGGKSRGVMLVGASWDGITKAAQRITYADFEAHGQVPPSPINRPCIVTELHYTHQAVYLAGRYNKYQRGVSHSRWEIAGQRLAEHSVEELIAGLGVKLLRGEAHRFSSAGREDADVLMLGGGRPFYLEVINPRRPKVGLGLLIETEEGINREAEGKIRVMRLQVVTKDSTWAIKDSASTKKKAYTTLVKLSSHRRSDLVRDKIIHRIHVYPEAGVTGDLVDTISAGTYVKEFVHGDCGRTVPSLKEMLDVAAAEVETLDVIDVDLDWPPERGE